MTVHEELDRIAISVKSHKRLKALLRDNPDLEEIMRNAKNETEALVGVRNWVLELLTTSPDAWAFYEADHPTREMFDALFAESGVPASGGGLTRDEIFGLFDLRAPCGKKVA